MSEYADTWHDHFRKNKTQTQPTVVLCESVKHLLYVNAPPHDEERRNYFVQNRQGQTLGSFWSEAGAREFIYKEEPDWDGTDYVSDWNNKAGRE